METGAFDLFGSRSPNGQSIFGQQPGLLTPGFDPRTMGLLGAAASLLAASGPSTTPQSFGQVVGKGLMGGVQSYQAGRQQEMEDLKAGLLMAQLKKQQSQIDALQNFGQPQAAPAAPAETPAGMSERTSQHLFGTPAYATQPAPQQAAAPSAQQIPDFASLIRAGVPGETVKALMEDWKLRNPEMQVQGGYAYNPRAIAPGFIPQVKVSDNGQAVGIVPGPNGLPTIAALPGAIDTYGQFRKSDERAKAGMTPFTLNVPGGTRQMPLDVGMDILRGIQSGGSGTPAPSAVTAQAGTPPRPLGGVGFRPDEATEAGRKAVAEAQGRSWVEREVSLRQSWNDAGAMRSGLDLMESLSRNPNVASGKLAEEISGLKSLAASLGVRVDGLPAEEAIKSIATEMALKAKNQGGTNLMPGAMAVFEQKLLQSMTPQLAQSAEGRMLMIQVFKAKAERDQHIAEMAAAYVDKHGRLDNGFEREVRAFAKANPMFNEQRAAAMQELARRMTPR